MRLKSNLFASRIITKQNNIDSPLKSFTETNHIQTSVTHNTFLHNLFSNKKNIFKSFNFKGSGRYFNNDWGQLASNVIIFNCLTHQVLSLCYQTFIYILSWINMNFCPSQIRHSGLGKVYGTWAILRAKLFESRYNELSAHMTSEPYIYCLHFHFNLLDSILKKNKHIRISTLNLK